MNPDPIIPEIPPKPDRVSASAHWAAAFIIVGTGFLCVACVLGAIWVARH